MKVKKVSKCNGSEFFTKMDAFILFSLSPLGEDVLQDCSLYIITADDCWSIHDEVCELGSPASSKLMLLLNFALFSTFILFIDV